jgi:glycosyltransferase involved in cell wall biosynthesis
MATLTSAKTWIAMRILHLLNYHGDWGSGIVHVAVDLACLQARMGHSVAIASQGGGFEALLGAHGVEVLSMPSPTRFVKGRLSLIVSMPGNVLGFRKLVHQWKPDIVHAHMITSTIVARCAFLRMPFTLITTVHNEFQKSASLMGMADRVIAVSDAVAASMKRRGISAEKISVVRNGPLGSPRHNGVLAPVSLQHPAILTVAGLSVRKGISDLISAFEMLLERVPEAHLYIVGDGPDREIFRAQAERSRASKRIHLEGFQRDARRYMSASEVFVLASHRDPFPLVIPEARACGCAIVATNVDGIPEALDGGKRGLLVEPKDPKALAEALADLLSDTKRLAKWRSLASEDLDWLDASRMAKETLEAYGTGTV